MNFFRDRIVKTSSVIICLATILSGIVACSGDLSVDDEGNGSTIVVTEVVSLEGLDVVVTRIVEQTPTVALPTAEVLDEPIDELVVLDTSFIRSTPPQIDPQKSISDDGIDLVENIFAGLTRFNHRTNTIDPMVAAEWESSNNGREWTFYLRDDIYWVAPSDAESDGTVAVQTIRPVTAQDFVFAIQRACHPETDTPDAFILFVIVGCEAVHTAPEVTPADLNSIGIQALNDKTLRIELNKPTAYLPVVTSMWLFRPLPPEILEEFGDEWQAEWTDGEAFRMMTSGPFFPLSASLQTLQANPHWPYPKEGNVDLVKILYLSEESNAQQLWDAKRLDIVQATELTFSEMNERQQAGVRFVPEQVLHYIAFNFDSGIFREAEVRRAFSAAIDRERLIEELFGEGQAIPMRHLMPPGVIGGLAYDEVGLGYNPDYARQQIVNSGFRSCRLMPDITLLVSSSDRSLQQAELIRRMWIEELGCTEDQIDIEQAQFGTLLANTRREAGANRPDIWELAWASYFPDAHNWMGNLLHCEDSENRSNRSCMPVDDLIREANSQEDFAERTALYRQIENEFFGEDGIMPIVPLYVRGEQLLVQNWLSFVPASFGGEQFDRYQIDYDRKQLELSR